MTTTIKHNDTLKPGTTMSLPKALADEEGAVSAEILRMIFTNRIESAAKKVKELVDAIQGKSFLRGEDAYARLAGCINKPEFRQRWRKLEKQLCIGSFESIVNLWISQEFPQLDIWKADLGEFWERRKKKLGPAEKLLPRLDRIDDLIKFLEENSKAHAREAALVAWSLLEKAENSGSDPADRDRLFGIRPVLMEGLKTRGLSEVLRFLEPISEYSVSPAKKQTSSTELSHVATKIESCTADPAHNDSIHSDGAADTQTVFQLEIDNLLKALDQKMPEVLESQKKLLSRLSGLLKETPLVKEVDKLVSATHLFRDELVMIEGTANKIISIIEGELSRLLADFNFHVPSPHNSEFPLAEYPGWRNKTIEILNYISDVVCHTQQLRAFCPEIKEAVIPKLVHTFSLSEVCPALGEMEGRAQTLNAERLARETFESFIARQHNDSDWNIFVDESLAPHHWRHWGEAFARDNGLSAELGICARKEYLGLSSKLAKTLELESEDSGELFFERALSCLEWLTLGQLEGLEVDSCRSRTVLLLIELNAAILASQNSSTIAHNYWSAFPLRDVINQVDDENTSALLHFLHRTCDQTTDAAWLVRELPLVCREIWSSSACSVVEDERVISLKQEIDHCLLLQIGGGDTYVELRTQAYEEIFSPLRKVLSNDGISAFIEKYSQMREVLDLDERIRSWKAVLQDRMRKRSQYEKSIRLMMTRKFDEIDRLIADWRLDQESKQADTVKLRRQQLSNLAKAVIESTSAASQMMVACLKEFARSGFRPLTYVASVGRTIDSDLDLSIGNASGIDVFHPRSFIRKLTGEPVSHGEYLTDHLMMILGYNTVANLAQVYLSRGTMEAYPELSASGIEEIPFELEIKFDEQIEELETNISKRLASIRAQMSAGGLAPDEIDGLVSKSEVALQAHCWTVVKRELDILEDLAHEQLQQAEAERQLKIIKDQVVSLGHTGPMPENLPDLRDLLMRLKADLEPRRKHITVLQEFRQLDALRPETAIALDEVLFNIDTYDCLPQPGDSAYISYVIEQALVPLTEELRRSKSYSPAHAQSLQALADRLVRDIASDDCFKASSTVIQFLETTSQDWPKLFEGQLAVEAMLRRFQECVDLDKQELENTSRTETAVTTGTEISEVWKDSLTWLARRYQGLANPEKDTPRESMYSLAANSDWEGAQRVAATILANAKEGSNQYIEALLCCVVRDVRLSDPGYSNQDFATALGLIARNPSNSLVQKLLPTKNSRGLLGDAVGKFLVQFSLQEDQREAIQSPSEAIMSLGRVVAFSDSKTRTLNKAFAVSPRGDSIVVKVIWDSFSGTAKQAEIRATLLKLLWMSSAKDAVAYCLTLSPNDIETKLATRLADVANQALEDSSRDLLQSFVDLKRTVNSKPFQLFVDMMVQELPSKNEVPARLSFSGPLVVSQGQLKGTLRIVPRSSDSPSFIVIGLPLNGPFLFEDGKSKKIIDGPFIGGPVEVGITLLRNKQAHLERFVLTVECEAVSITRKKELFRNELEVQIETGSGFEPIPTSEIDSAFGDYPEFQVRGSEFVPRPKDERKIEKALFGGNVVRSIWISSPRRSGKTSMLYRIVDGYSVGQGRDNAIIFLTLDTAFETSSQFNRWVWDKVRVGRPNKILREHIGLDFSRLGKDLPFDADSGTFLSEFADTLINIGKGIRRVIFLIDEVDKLASMHIAGGRQREAASGILWQIRNSLIADREDVGVVFAGSTAARRLFVLSSEGPFFNSILPIELTPFSCDDQSAEKGSRAIVEPDRIRGRYVLPTETLSHLVKICAGIPYYMKLLAGATFAVAKQRHLSVSNVNEGLAALLEKCTGSEHLDKLDDPGADELRILNSEDRSMRIVAKSVLYTAAELGNPLSGRPLRRARLSGVDSPLVAGFELPKPVIEDGIDRCLDLGVLRVVENGAPELIFAIPILGEALRVGRGHFWSTVSHQLEEISRSLREEAL